MVNENSIGSRQELYGPNGEIRQLTIKHTQFSFAHHYYNLNKAAEIEVCFDKPTFLFCLGYGVNIKMQTGKEIEVAEKTIRVLYNPNNLAIIPLKTFKIYDLFFLECTPALLRYNGTEAKQVKKLEQKILSYDMQISDEEICISDECLYLTEIIITSKVSKVASTIVLGSVRKLMSAVLKEMNGSTQQQDDLVVVNAAKDYITENLQAYTTMKEYCNKAGLTNTLRLKMFEKFFGITASEFIQSARIEKAKKLINANCHLRFIAKTIGCSDPDNFSAFFKKRTSQTPNEYKKSNLSMSIS